MAFYLYKIYSFILNITKVYILQKMVLLCNINFAYEIIIIFNLLTKKFIKK